MELMQLERTCLLNIWVAAYDVKDLAPALSLAQASRMSRDDPRVARASSLQPDDGDSFSFPSAVRRCKQHADGRGGGAEGDLCSRKAFPSRLFGACVR